MRCKWPARLGDGPDHRLPIGFNGRYVTRGGELITTWIPDDRNPSKLVEHFWTGKEWVRGVYGQFVPIPQFCPELADAMKKANERMSDNIA